MFWTTRSRKLAIAVATAFLSLPLLTAGAADASYSVPRPSLAFSESR